MTFVQFHVEVDAPPEPSLCGGGGVEGDEGGGVSGGNFIARRRVLRLAIVSARVHPEMRTNSSTSPGTVPPRAMMSAIVVGFAAAAALLRVPPWPESLRCAFCGGWGTRILIILN